MNGQPKRHEGYVTGHSRSGKCWMVKVKDPASEYHGTRMPIASICGDITLAKGLNVNFCVGSVDDQQGQPANRAVDVRLSKSHTKSIRDILKEE